MHSAAWRGLALASVVAWPQSAVAQASQQEVTLEAANVEAANVEAATVEAATVEDVTIAAALAEAWAASPVVARASADVAAAEANRAVHGVFLPNPDVEASATSDGPFQNQGELAMSVALVQELAWPGARMARVDAAEHGIRASRLRLALARLGVAADVERALGTLAAANDELRVREEIAKSARSLADAAKRRVEAGAAGQVEATLARADDALADATLTRSRTERDAAAAALCATLARSSCEAMSVQAPWASLAALPTSGVERDVATRVDVRAAAADVDAAAKSVDAAELTRIPSARLGVGYSFDQSVVDAPALGGSVRDPDHLVGVTLSVTLPVWDWKTGDVARARADAARAQADKHAIELQAKSSVRAALSRHRAAADAETRLLEVGADVERALADVANAYVAGGLALGEALAVRDRLLRMRIELIDARRRKVEAHAAALEALADPSVVGIEVTP